MTRIIRTDRGDAGRRLDHALRRHLADLEATRTAVQRWIAEGRVTVDGVLASRASARVPASAVVEVALPCAGGRAAPALDEGDLEVLYQDDVLIAVNKPAGMVAHPTHAYTRGTLLNMLLWHGRDWPEGQRPSLVGRLDRQTSGIVLVARTAGAHAALQRALRVGEKDYLAVVAGRVREARGRIDAPIGRDPRDRRRMAIAALGAPSLTLFERLARASAGGLPVALLRCRLVTGRTHQIRVHLASRGWPIVGDAVYGANPAAAKSGPVPETVRGFARQALHAWKVTLVHPVSRERLLIEAPIPDDLRGLMEALGLRGREAPA